MNNAGSQQLESITQLLITTRPLARVVRETKYAYPEQNHW